MEIRGGRINISGPSFANDYITSVEFSFEESA